MTSRNVNRRLLPRQAGQKGSSMSVEGNEQMKQKQRISQQLKEKYIEDLQERNKKLKFQIKRITEILQQNEQKEQQKVKERQKNLGKNHKSIISRNFNEMNPQVLKKELENVYKQIKNYQREIQKVQNYRVGSKNSSDQIAKLQSIRHEKLQHLQKLNQQLSTLSNLQAQNSKRLKNNMGRQYYENQIIKVGDQLKVLREKQRSMQEKEKKKVTNAKKQLEFIKKLQTELLQGGISMDEIEEMKRKNIFIQIKNIMNKPKDDDQIDTPQKNIPEDQGLQQEHITFQKLQEMKNEIKLYKKLHQDYQKRLQNIQKDKDNADKMISQKKKAVQQKNADIQNLLNQINEIKQLVRKNSVVANGTLPGNADSIRKIQRKKSIEASQSQSRDKDEKKNTKSISPQKSK